MTPSVSVLRLSTGFDCEGKTWSRGTSYICRLLFAVKMTLHLLNACAKFLGETMCIMGDVQIARSGDCKLLKRTGNLIYATTP